MADPSTKDPTDVLAIGDKGFTFQMLKEVPKVAGKTFAYYQGAHLQTVKPNFSKLDDVQIPYCAKKKREWEDKLEDDSGIFYAPKNVRDRDKRNIKQWTDTMKQLGQDRAQEDALVQSFNASVPRANQTFASLARLEAMEEMLGVKDPKAMSEALIKSMNEVEPMAEGLASKDGALPLLQAHEDVGGAAKRSTQAQKEMQAAWRSMQELLIVDHAGALRKKGEKDEQRLAQINETISFARKVGGAIDVSMTIMSGGATMIEGGGGGKPTPSQMTDLLAEEAPSVADKSGVDGAKKVGGAITKAMGIEIPTDAAGLLETAAKIWYWGELDEIRKRLAELNSQISMHEEVAKEIGLKAKVETLPGEGRRLQARQRRAAEAHVRPPARLPAGRPEARPGRGEEPRPQGLGARQGQGAVRDGDDGRLGRARDAGDGRGGGRFVRRAPASCSGRSARRLATAAPQSAACPRRRRRRWPAWSSSSRTSKRTSSSSERT